MENVIITLIITAGSVFMITFVSKTVLKFRENSAVDLKRQLTNANQKIAYWRGKFNKYQEEDLDDLEDLDLGDLGDLGDLEDLPVIGKYMKIPKYRKIAEAFIQGIQKKKENVAPEEKPGHQQFLE